MGVVADLGGWHLDGEARRVAREPQGTCPKQFDPRDGPREVLAAGAQRFDHDPSVLRPAQDERVDGVALGREAFNIGRTARNFNEPTLGLLVLEPRRRSQFSFERTQVEREGDVDLVTLTFQERRGPTLVRSVDGGDLFSSGELTIEAGTGRIRRTLIRFPSGPVAAELTTVYAHEPKLDLWVPVRLLERYERTGRAGELTLGESTYTNWRRFEVDIRIR